MKTIKTASGFKKIDDQGIHFISLQLRSILQDHRSTLIDKMIAGGLDSYISYKFDKKTNLKELQKLKDKLIDLRNSGINVEIYKPIFDTVIKHEFTTLGNAMFYEEIDKVLKEGLFMPDLFNASSEEKQVSLN